MPTAQDLLEQWAAEKLNFYDDSDVLEPSTVSQTSKTATEIKREWDRLTELENDNYLTSAHDVASKGPTSQNSKQQKNSGRKHSVMQLNSHTFLSISMFSLNYTVRQKNDTQLLPITSPNIGRFSKFFHC